MRGEVALALGRMGDSSVIPVLLDSLSSDSNHQVRWRSAIALGRVGDGSIIGDLEAALESEADAQVGENLEDAIADLREG